MKYSIVASKPKDLRSLILKSVRDGKDTHDSSIDTWEVRVVTINKKDGTKTTEEMLVHTTQAWADWGCIRLVVDKESQRHVYAQFLYWDNIPQEDCDGTHELYLYGRLTELLLVHFNEKITSVMITQK